MRTTSTSCRLRTVARKPKPGAAARRDEIVRLIEQSVAAHGFPPSLQELAEATHVSLRQIALDVGALREQGRVTWIRGRARTLRVLPPPES